MKTSRRSAISPWQLEVLAGDERNSLKFTNIRNAPTGVISQVLVRFIR